MKPKFSSRFQGDLFSAFADEPVADVSAGATDRLGAGGPISADLEDLQDQSMSLPGKTATSARGDESGAGSSEYSKGPRTSGIEGEPGGGDHTGLTNLAAKSGKGASRRGARGGKGSARATEPDFSGSPGNGGQDRVGHNPLGAPSRSENSKRLAEHPVRGIQKAGSSQKEKECHSFMPPGVPVVDDEGTDASTGSDGSGRQQGSKESRIQIATPAPAISTRGTEAVVNDCKVEPVSMTGARSTRETGLGGAFDSRIDNRQRVDPGTLVGNAGLGQSSASVCRDLRGHDAGGQRSVGLDGDGSGTVDATVQKEATFAVVAGPASSEPAAVASSSLQVRPARQRPGRKAKKFGPKDAEKEYSKPEVDIAEISQDMEREEDCGGAVFKGNPMEDLTILQSLCTKAKVSDKPQLIMATKLMRIHGLAVKELVQLGEVSISSLLEDGLPHLYTGEIRAVRKPLDKARGILLALGRLAEQFPNVGLPDPVLHRPEPILACLKLSAEPETFHANIQTWGELSKQTRGSETGPRNALSDISRHAYAYSARQWLAVCWKLGKVTGKDFGVMAMTEVGLATEILAAFDSLYTPSNVATILAAVTRVTLDLFENNQSHMVSIAYLQAEVSRRFPKLALSVEATKAIERILTDPVRMKRLYDAPLDMKATAYETSLRPQDRYSRMVSAVIVQLKLDHPALTATDAAHLQRNINFRKGPEGFELRLPNPRERGRYVWQPLTQRANGLLTELDTLKKNYGITADLFCPTIADSTVPQGATRVMAMVYSRLSLAVRENMTFDELKLLRCYQAVKMNRDRLPAISEAAGYRDPRALARRLGLLGDRRRRANGD